MRPEQQLFAMALGLGEPWEVKNINFDAETSRLDIKIDFERASLFACPVCGKMCGVKDSKEKTWRHLNFFQHECYLTARTPRTNCDEHGEHQVDVPWARERSGFTLLFEAFVMALLKKMPVKSVGHLLNIHDTKLWRVFNHYISKTRKLQNYSEVSKVGIDETSSKKRHKYISLFVDLDKRKLLFGTSGRKAEVVKTFVDDLKEHKGNAQNVTVACCDLSPSFYFGC